MSEASRRRISRVLVAATVLVLAGCGIGGSGTGVRASGTMEFSEEYRTVVVEFEASLVSLVGSGFYVGLYETKMASSKDYSQFSEFEREYWDGQAWVSSQMDDPEVSGVGPNVFRFRWTVTIGDGVGEIEVPFEVEAQPTWGDGSDMPPPDENYYADLAVSVVSTRPGTRG